MQMADRMAEDGYLEAGYEYLSVDDCWMAKERSQMGTLVTDPERFPNGMKAVIDYVSQPYRVNSVLMISIIEEK